MPHRAFRMTYVVDLGGGLPLIGAFATLEDARHWAREFCKTSSRYTSCEVRPIMPALFACAETLDEEAEAG